MTPYTNLERKKRVDVPQHLALMCPNTLLAHGVKKATPQSATNTSEASNHNVNEAYTMALQHSTQTRPKFQYLFLAVCRSDLNAKPHRESVTAHSEQDARRSLAGQFVLSFAGRIPAQGVCNA
ncbi:TPA: host cell division inhibitor Icd-like protein [Yersinia enterocolitica]|uniref:host cell division inhibitor Icd-like protein n=1 Tax=Yersinia enterocolitica TaxID=630 RepID=UPI0029819905|nr:host cell division inhibitor Icd-like protein [Yersinia enterocolitica]